MDAGFAALMITVVVLLSGTAIKIASLWTRRHQPGPGRTELSARMEAMESELAALQRELAETQERLDFTERVLAQGAETRRVAPPEAS